MLPRRTLLAALLPNLARATIGEAALPVLRIGVLTDLSGSRAEATGLGSIAAARMAALEIGAAGIDRTIEVVSADAGHSADFAASIIRSWFNTDSVEAIVDVPDEAVALKVQRICAERGKIALFCGAMSASLANEACSPTGFQWTMDSYAIAGALAAVLPAAGGASAFLVVTDDPIGQDLQRHLAAQFPELRGVATIDADGNAAAALAAAATSGASVVVLCGGGQMLARQAAACIGPDQMLAATTLSLSDIQAIGPAILQGLWLAQPFYWASDERARAWSARFALRAGRPPDAPQIGVYGAVRHYLHAVSELGTSDGPAVARRMRYTSIEDPFSRGARVRADGRVLRPMLVARVKAPADSREPWDLLSIVKTVPAEAVTRPIDQSRCRLLPGSAG